tara:strand:- start:7493 stop:7816 length:324 start_codon:yes stop_codon:yes gene_type:complete
MSDEEKSLPEQLEQLADSIPHSYVTLRTAAFEIRHLESVNKASETLRWDDQAHHEAKIRLVKAEHDDLLEKLNTLVTIAQAGLAKNKPHVTEYQLDRMCDLLGDSNA